MKKGPTILILGECNTGKTLAAHAIKKLLTEAGAYVQLVDNDRPYVPGELEKKLPALEDMEVTIQIVQLAREVRS